MISEKKIVSLIKSLCPLVGSVICGIGDDCAVIQENKNFLTLWTTDALVFGVHFDATYSATDIGHKLLAVNLSDIAAMGGKPLHALVSMGLPKNLDSRWIKNFYKGLNLLARPIHVSIVGGNLSQSPNLWLDLSLQGCVRKNHVKYRHGAKIGDLIYVTGPLGRATCGLHFPETKFVKYLRKPRPRVAEGIFLGSQKAVTSMIDISDGLVSDLNEILSSSSVGAEIGWNQIPVDPAMGRLISDRDMLERLVLAGGEDYELLFTVNTNLEKKFLVQAAQKGFNFYRIGKIQKKGLRIMNGKRKIRLQQTGFDHFKI